MKQVFLTIFSSVFFNNAFAGSCCGGGSSSSLILISDNKEEYGIGMSFRNDVGQTDSDGYSSFYSGQTKDQQLNLNIQYQRIIADRFQAAFKTSFVQKDINKSNIHETKNGPGDIELQGTYEFLPEYTYSMFKPRGFVYLKQGIPLSRSLYNSQSAVFSDVTGSGFYSTSIGSFFLKHVSDYNLKLSLEWQHFYSRSFGALTVANYEKFYVPIGISYAIPASKFALGLGQNFNYQSPKRFSGSVNGSSNKEYFWETNFNITYSVNLTQNVSMSYSDSTLTGKNVNSPLYRSIGISFSNGVPF